MLLRYFKGGGIGHPLLWHGKISEAAIMAKMYVWVSLGRGHKLRSLKGLNMDICTVGCALYAR